MIEQVFQSTQRHTVVAPQDNNYGCVFCTLEYLTGVSRNQIAKEIGHDGSDKIDDAPEPHCYATLESYESIHWLYKRGLYAVELYTREYLKQAYEAIQKPYFAKRYHPTEKELIAMLTGKSAMICVKSKKFKDSLHAVAYIAGIILDPRDGHVYNIADFELIGVTLIPNLDPYKRLKEIYVAQKQEQLTVV